ncbi:endonuclease I family protein [Marinicella meishanensis]|uniref:endonuclease I family protein n=1 Tax=Marinicella meishanensis TaxID=2873263 RepID=UPI001CC0C6DF|nr:endonuclease [Marinicella sp. NBU2979]
MKKLLSLVLLVGTVGSAQADLEDLLVSQLSVRPATAEFIEIHNTGGTTLDLTDVYLTDATFANGSVYYYQLVDGAGGGGGFADFYARFPAGASIAPGEKQSIGLNGSDDFFAEYGLVPTYELFEDGPVADAVPDMLEATPGSINGQGGLSDGGEVVVLLHWDGVSDLVDDLDYVLWGDKVEAIDKTGVTSGVSTYANDTPIASQDVVDTGAHADGNAWIRIDDSEGTETQAGGNGIAGDDETSENTGTTFSEGLADPAGDVFVPIDYFLINEIDAVSSGADFIELLGDPNTGTDDYTLVLYDGVTDVSTAVISLDGMSTDANGYLVINQTLEDGADAVALYNAAASNFMVGDPITTTDLMDAIVYDSGQADDAELLALLNPGQPQVNEDANGDALNESLIRCTNGSGGFLNTSSFKAFTPSPGAENADCVTFDGYYDTADPTNAQTLRDSLHEIIDDHCVFNYSGPDAGTCGEPGVSEDTWSILSLADEDPQQPGQVWMVYKNNNYPFMGGGQQAYNREHTWPQSYGFSSGTLGSNNAARTDAHHLMMSDVGYNSDRGNLYFDDCNAGCNERTTDVHNNPNPGGGTIGGGSGTYPGNSNWFDANSFEVWNFRKGDIARAMFYMDVRYAGDTAGEVDLQLVERADVGLIQSGNPYMGILEVLLAWHESDPVDDIERNRNNIIFNIQKNRNPFIDHPEWVECIFVDGGTCPVVDNDLIFADDFE